MAEIQTRMTAHGQPHEKCEGCGRQFGRGEQMTAIALDDGEPAGWFDASCVRRWHETGEQPTPEIVK